MLFKDYKIVDKLTESDNFMETTNHTTLLNNKIKYDLRAVFYKFFFLNKNHVYINNIKNIFINIYTYNLNSFKKFEIFKCYNNKKTLKIKSLFKTIFIYLFNVNYNKINKFVDEDPFLNEITVYEVKDQIKKFNLKKIKNKISFDKKLNNLIINNFFTLTNSKYVFILKKNKNFFKNSFFFLKLNILNIFKNYENMFLYQNIKELLFTLNNLYSFFFIKNFKKIWNIFFFKNYFKNVFKELNISFFNKNTKEIYLDKSISKDFFEKIAIYYLFYKKNFLLFYKNMQKKYRKNSKIKLKLCLLKKNVIKMFSKPLKNNLKYYKLILSFLQDDNDLIETNNLVNLYNIKFFKKKKVFKFFKNNFEMFDYFNTYLFKPFRFFNIFNYKVSKFNPAFSFFLVKNKFFINHKKKIKDNLTFYYIKPDIRKQANYKYFKYFFRYRKNLYFNYKIILFIKLILFNKKDYVNSYINLLFSNFNINLKNKIFKNEKLNFSIGFSKPNLARYFYKK